MPSKLASAVLTCLAFAPFASAQPAPDSPKKPDFSKESFIIANTSTTVRFSSDGTSRRAIATSVKILSDAGLQAWGVLSVPYASDYEHIEVHFVRVRKADSTTVETPVANILDLPSDVTRAAPMYSDLKQKQIPVKALSVGDTLEFEFAYIQDKPLVPGQFWFSYNFNRSAVVLAESLEVRVPRDLKAKVSSTDIQPTVTQEGQEKVYSWITAHAEGEPAADAENAGEPEKPSVQISTFSSWEEVGHWYGKLADPQAKITPAIQAKADALVKNLPSEQGKIEAIYDFVSTKIRYISLSFGIGRYQPHAAADVLENEYGDCKDKHTLLAALLKAEGIDAWPALIHSSEKLDEDVPSPAQFNHLITVVPRGKDFLWLDTTPEVAPFGMLLRNLRDKQALVVPTTGAPRLMKTPVDPPFAAEDHLDMRGALDSEGTFKGHGELTLRSDAEVIYRSLFHSSARSRWQDEFQNVSYRLGFAGEVSNVQVDDPDNTHTPFHISWDYLRKKYGDWDDRQTLPPTGGVPINTIDEEKMPSVPIEIGFNGTTLYTAEMQLPPGYTMSAPSNIDLRNDFAEFHVKYSVIAGKFIAEKRLTVLKQELPAANWRSYVAFQKEVMNDFNHFIPLTAPSVNLAGTGAADNPEAADLIQKAYQAFQERELVAAEDDLEKARKINPRQTNLNAAFGSLYLMQGKIDEGIEAFRREAKEHPENLRVQRAFAAMLTQMHRDDDAIEIYAGLLKQAPEDVDANSNLAKLLVAKNDWKRAQPVLEETYKLRPDNAQVKVWYGQSCLKNGKDAEGLAALKSAAESASDPAMLSTIASALADAGQSLDVAQKASAQAVTLIEQQTADIALTGISNLQMKKMVDLTRVWDHAGWIAFRNGDLLSAERYLSAAWKISEDPVAGDHLGQVYEKQGKVAAALAVDQLALSRGLGTDASLADRVSALRKRVGTAQSKTGRFQQDDLSRLQDLRTVRFAPAKRVSASADFLVLFEHGKAIDVKPLGGDATVEALSDSLKAAKFDTAFPDDGPERVVRRGILSCSVYDPNCMFLMLLPSDADATPRPASPTHATEIKALPVHP